MQKTADLQLEFVKYAYSNALENLSHNSERWTKTRELLKRKGFEDSYFETTYKSDPMINKLYYIMRDNNLLEEFKQSSYDLQEFKGLVDFFFVFEENEGESRDFPFLHLHDDILLFKIV